MEDFVELRFSQQFDTDLLHKGLIYAYFVQGSIFQENEYLYHVPSKFKHATDRFFRLTKDEKGSHITDDV